MTFGTFEVGILSRFSAVLQQEMTAQDKEIEVRESVRNALATKK
jgi:hypothetical protein